MMPVETKTVRAPCKVNLTLDVFPLRSDGFHDIDSIVVPFSPADELTISWQPSPNDSRVELTCDDPELPTGAGNLAYLAAQRLLTETMHSGIAQIDLRKRLPYQAGLGSASSDAATVLRCLGAMLATNEALLLRIAQSIGSDVPLFLHAALVRMRGRGERVEPVAQRLPTLHGVLVKPHVGVATGPAYALLDAVLNRRGGMATEKLLSVLQSTPNDLSAVAAALGNDFEAAILPAFPEVRAAHHAVSNAGALRALLCGSGSAVFGLARSAEHAESIAESLRTSERFAWVQVAESLS